MKKVTYNSKILIIKGEIQKAIESHRTLDNDMYMNIVSKVAYNKALIDVIDLVKRV